jgi:phytoene dehydrogenase-like protein
MSTERHDVVIVGGGHNALVAATYLARADLDVVVLERLDRVGGAAVSLRPFDDFDARLSRYSYLVSRTSWSRISGSASSCARARRRRTRHMTRAACWSSPTRARRPGLRSAR